MVTPPVHRLRAGCHQRIWPAACVWQGHSATLVRHCAAAEAWALLQVLTMLPFPPEMRTDCMSLLHTIRGSSTEAGCANRQLARIWRAVANVLGRCFKPVHEAQQLVWLPAHTTTNAVGEAKLSNGRRLSMIGWRANRLVDALAKLSALEAQNLPAAIQLIRSSEAAVKSNMRPRCWVA